MRTGTRILVAAALLTASATAGLAQGPYDGSSYWDRVERQQDCAWKAQGSPYPPAFAYDPSQPCNYGPPAAQYYAPASPAPYQYSAPASPSPYQYSYRPYSYYR
jgi:hypothetical protein